MIEIGDARVVIVVDCQLEYDFAFVLWLYYKYVGPAFTNSRAPQFSPHKRAHLLSWARLLAERFGRAYSVSYERAFLFDLFLP